MTADCSLSVLTNTPCHLKSFCQIEALTPFQSFDEKTQQLLLWRAGVARLETVCAHHYEVFITRFELFHRSCCNPFFKHQKKTSRSLREVSLRFAKKCQGKIELVPGKKLCTSCLKDVYALLQERMPEEELLPPVMDETAQNFASEGGSSAPVKAKRKYRRSGYGIGMRRKKPRHKMRHAGQKVSEEDAKTSESPMPPSTPGTPQVSSDPGTPRSESSATSESVHSGNADNSASLLPPPPPPPPLGLPNMKMDDRQRAMSSSLGVAAAALSMMTVPTMAPPPSLNPFLAATGVGAQGLLPPGMNPLIAALDRGYASLTAGMNLASLQQISQVGYNPSTIPGRQSMSKYAQLLAVIEDLGKDIRPTYAGSKGSAERLKRGIVHARILVRECLMETERSARS